MILGSFYFSFRFLLGVRFDVLGVGVYVVKE